MQQTGIQHVDFTPFTCIDVNHPPVHLNEQQRHTAKQLHHSIQTHGFLFLRNIGMSSAEMQQALQCARQLFDKPLSYKLSTMKIMDLHSNCGYIAEGREVLNPQRTGELKEVKHHCHSTQITVYIHLYIYLQQFELLLTAACNLFISPISRFRTRAGVPREEPPRICAEL